MMSSMTSSMMMTEDFDEEEDETSGTSWRDIGLYFDRCNRMIQNEFRDPNGGNVCLFSAATCTSQCKLRSLRAKARPSGT